MQTPASGRFSFFFFSTLEYTHQAQSLFSGFAVTVTQNMERVEDVERSKKRKGGAKKEKRESLFMVTVFQFNGTKANSGNTVLELALDVIVPAEKYLSFLRGCIQIYSLAAGTDHSGNTLLWQ